MHVTFDCPACLRSARSEVADHADRLCCEQCGWTRPLCREDVRDAAPTHCLLCGCEDLWRQKDFPQQLGLLMVGMGIVLSTIAWAYHQPLIAIGILMAFAAIDMVLYVVMPDVLVCYRCHARYRRATIGDDHPRFNLELNERYRQETPRLQQATQSPSNSALK